MLTPEFVEREYNNRALVKDYPRYFDRWTRDSEFVRATLVGELEVPYGPDPRHRIDLFPAGERALGTLVFIHGGYWRSLDKDMFSWIAAAWNAAGVSVALPRYRLAPAVRIEDIVGDAIAATTWLFEHGARHRMNMDRVVLSGHSAGGHLAAAIMAAPRERLAFDTTRIAGAVPISGIFDFEPLRLFSFNSDFRLDAASVARLGLADKMPSVDAPLIVAAGADESSEFRRQSQLLADAWKSRGAQLMLMPGAHHFSIVDAFAERGAPLHEGTLALFTRRSIGDVVSVTRLPRDRAP
ncbi:MAG TPA: alpha/beta hydrolase [Usitatibacter sp.]|jgi:arylformamidase|nr:alpha/beta hydrolase [Usitatibacter sp.]